MTEAPRLSFCMIARDEAANIVRCLDLSCAHRR